MEAPNTPMGNDNAQAGLPEKLEGVSRKTSQLEFLLLLTLVVVIVLSVGLNVLLSSQVKMLQARYNEQEPAVKQYAKGYLEIDEPLYRKFALSLQQYASTNRDFQPIWDKYRPMMSNLLTTAKSAPAPAQAGQPAKK